ncbi:hypothetical protein EJ05DRAFT_51032 [Pseudovirgaria hyperparasitica]|uniref:Uncharacterized protein n=1 Tax=Pseudovirgaria hyperparasitica TaxID=470096 RepID=A0A6A6W4Z7_9PEZI|nr:uncharacterized protein EJ05DRAFT_51032 [Pseudovirgaria hyperparasitica]KAF2757000.1 hypothetical protein EJ05DRAFT_51032 [Pseudovirgaria hyperparasitica]
MASGILHQEIIVISSTGDLVLNVSHEEHQEESRYRVDSGHIRRTSPYFEHLLGGAFSEATAVHEKHRSLRDQYSSFEDVPADELPCITVVHIGQISKVNSIEGLTADFLRVLHGLELSQPNPPVPNIANLAIVADRFDCLGVFCLYAKKKGIFRAIDARARGKNTSEERVRQKLLVGYLLDHNPWVTKNSKHLILSGSKRWDPPAQEQEDTESALWWDLPHGIEEELQYRRERVLETLSSIPLYFLHLYMSGERQCKLGYDSSLACDSFQLGEMVRFLSRAGMLRVRSLLYDPINVTAYSGDIDRLVDSLRKCPKYQIDSNHAHCGLRSRMLPVLGWLQYWLDKDSGSPDLGLCPECFKARRGDYAWAEAKRPLMWRRTGTLSHTGKPKHAAPADWAEFHPTGVSHIRQGCCSTSS